MARNDIVRAAVLLATLGVVSCVESQVQVCSDRLLCPPGKACAPELGGCVSPEQLDACRGQSDGGGGSPSGTAVARCRKGVCFAAECGNGFLDPGEQCDDGNLEPGDGCTPDCSLCGNGRIDSGEECDDGARNSDAARDACRSTCRLPACGDAVTDTGEQCDTGDSVGGCQTDARCAELCTDGLDNDADGEVDCFDEDCDGSKQCVVLFDSIDQFQAQAQGHNGAYYYRYSGGVYTPLSMDPTGQFGYWAIGFPPQDYGSLYLSSTTGHPGATEDAVYAWVSDHSGPVRVLLVYSDADARCGDGGTFRIQKNDVVIAAADYPNGAPSKTLSATTSLTAGDRVQIHLGRLGSFFCDAASYHFAVYPLE